MAQSTMLLPAGQAKGVPALARILPRDATAVALTNLSLAPPKRAHRYTRTMDEHGSDAWMS